VPQTHTSSHTTSHGGHVTYTYIPVSNGFETVTESTHVTAHGGTVTRVSSPTVHGGIITYSESSQTIKTPSGGKATVVTKTQSNGDTDTFTYQTTRTSGGATATITD
jgi:hypothetical protein